MVEPPLLLREDVTIATAAYGNAASTKACLNALFRSVTGDFELILIDDCSPDSGETRSIFLDVKRRHSNTKVFSFTENLEYSGSLNAILSHASGHWVFFVSNDIFVTPHYFRALLDVAKANPHLGILRGSSNFVDNGLATHNVELLKPVHSIDDIFEIGAKAVQHFGLTAQADPFLVGDAFLVTRPVISRIGTFDPMFFGYFADPDYGLRAQVEGFGLALVRGAFAFHHQNANFDYLPEAQRQEKMNRRFMRVYENWARFKVKWQLGVELMYPGADKIPWTDLAARPCESARRYSAPGDYARYLI